jgi:CheY-like chemotaxis protein
MINDNVLLIEDNIVNIISLKKSLINIGFANIDVIRNKYEALENYNKYQIIIIDDNTLNIKDITELANNSKSNDQTIIVLSSSLDAYDNLINNNMVSTIHSPVDLNFFLH